MYTCGLAAKGSTGWAPFSSTVAYQVTWGGGEAWMVQVSRTVVPSQTAWERRGIQNQGPRPEHSS